MIKSDTLYGLIIWLIILSGAYFYYGIYVPNHPPKPSTEEIAKQNKNKAEKAYKKAHPEEDENFAILSAKYGVGIKSVQIVINTYESWHADRQKNKQSFIFDIAKKAGISQQVVAAILIDYSYLTSDCSQPEPEYDQD